MSGSVQSPRAIRFGAYTLDLSAGELHKNGTKVRLPEQPFQILQLLLQRPGEVVTREELRQHLWSDHTFVDFETGLNSAVKKLRDVLGDSAEKPRFVETIPRRGYRFIHPVESLAASPALARVAWWRTPWATTSFAVAALLSVAVAFNLGGLRNRIFAASVGPIHSVAVLPARNLTADPEMELLADGLTDALTTRLWQAKSLVVPSVTSVMSIKGERRRLPDIARELKVQAVVELSVQRAGQRLQINVQLIYGPLDRHLWAKIYVCDPKDLQVVLPGVARDLIVAMKVPLTPQERAHLSRDRETTPEAYEAYLLGRHYFSRQRKDLEAKEYFEKAISKDPGFAPAYASLAELYSRGQYPAVQDLRGSYSEARPIARQYALKALELDDNLAEAHTALGWVDLTDWDWSGAGREFRRAIELNSSYPLAHIWYAEYLAAIKLRFPEAIDQAKFAQQLDPASPYINVRSADVYLFARRFDQARECARRALELEPGHVGAHIALAQADIIGARYLHAIAELEQIPPGDRGGFVLGNLGCAYALAGQREKALKLVSELERRAERDNVPPEATAYVYVGLGDKDKAFACLERAYRQHRFLFYLNVKTMWEPLRSDPRFKDLVRRVGLPSANAK